MSKLRYTLHYLHERGEFWEDNYVAKWEQMNFKTLKEAQEYKSIAGDKSYIIDNVTGKKL